MFDKLLLKWDNNFPGKLCAVVQNIFTKPAEFVSNFEGKYSLV